MKRVLLVLLWIACAPALVEDLKTSLLQAWENLQANSADVAEFRKLAERKYWIKFVSLPYEGELTVLAYDTEDFSLGMTHIPYAKLGYVEVDLVDASSEEIAKYARTHSKWVQNNTFYYNRESGAWETFAEYRKLLEQETEDLAPSSWILMLFENAHLLLIAILVYFGSQICCRVGGASIKIPARFRTSARRFSPQRTSPRACSCASSSVIVATILAVVRLNRLSFNKREQEETTSLSRNQVCGGGLPLSG